ncbi:MAG: hypothetical protein JST01_15215 [Cyanobacteria bacterium SZAS TMP-1]|nr:hypothetical protein [Cyanobacteria bacterium SZAS TMP-1]
MVPTETKSTSANWRLKLLLGAQSATFVLLSAYLFIFSYKPTTVLLKPVPGFIELKIDVLALSLVLLITFIAGIVAAFSERYLVAEQERVQFIQYLLVISILASLLVTSNNLILWVLCWHGISLVLWSLMRLRQQARESARQVLANHMISDASMLAAAAMIFYCCKTLSLTDLTQHAADLQQHVYLLGLDTGMSFNTLISIFLVLSMSIKSALFPFHRWLLATLDAPTPLSGLLHAGVVNISAVAAARFLPILAPSTAVLMAWGILAAVSAAFGTLVMSTQSDVKRKLVYSTVGQMGFMCLQCASGAIPSAVFHLIAHGLFKCHLFLQSGSAVSEGLVKKCWGQPQTADDGKKGLPGPAFIAGIAATAAALSVWMWQDDPLHNQTGIYGVLAAAGFTAVLPMLKRARPGQIIACGALFCLTAVISCLASNYLLYEFGATSLASSSLLPIACAVFALCGMALHFIRPSKLGQAAYVHLLNGLYLEEIISAINNRLSKQRQSI